MRGRIVSDVQWTALRELREGEPPTFPRLAAAAELHPGTIRERALRDSWEKQNLPRSGSRALAEIERDMPKADLPPDELRKQLATILPKQIDRIVALAERGRLSKAPLDTLHSILRLLERPEMLSVEQPVEEKKRSDDELAGMLQRIDERIVELAVAHAERLVQARDREGMG
jgi:hypothetical protein